jgi:hypothetical protein
LKQYNFCFRATLAFLKLYGWQQVGLVRASVNFDRLSSHSLKNLLKENGIAVNVELDLDPYMQTKLLQPESSKPCETKREL